MSVDVDVPFVDLDGDGDVRRGRKGFDVDDNRFLTDKASSVQIIKRSK